MQTNLEKIKSEDYQNNSSQQIKKPNFFYVKLKNLRNQFESESDLIIVRASIISALTAMAIGFGYLNTYGNFDPTVPSSKVPEQTKAIIMDAIATKVILSIAGK